jgi:hypothetical protein
MTYENWVVNTATVQSCDSRDAARTQSSLFVGHFVVGFSYAIGDTHYSGKCYSSREWEIGTILGMLYNPQNPEESCVCDEGEGEWIVVDLGPFC